MPNRLRNTISLLQKSFIPESNNGQLKKKWANIEDVKSFYIVDSESCGWASSNEFGELMKGRFSGCLVSSVLCTLWSENVLLKNEYDISVMN